MADNTINVRIKQKIDTESNWSTNNPVLLKGEKGLIEGTSKYKIGDGTSKWSDLPLYEGMTASDRSKLNGIASGANKTTVDSALSSTSTNPVQNKVVNSALAGKSNTNHTHDLSTMINTLSIGTATPNDDDYYISQYSGGGNTTTTYHRRPLKALFEYIKGKLHKVAVSGSYNDLSNKPTIPSVGNGTITIKQAGTSKGTFTMNQSGNTTIELTDNNTTYPTGTSSTSGLTKLYTGTGTATDGTMTQAAIKSALDGKSNTSHTHNTIKDIGDGGDITFAYSKAGLDYGNYTWLAAWNGKELRAINKNQFATSGHTHRRTAYVGSDTADTAGWYKVADQTMSGYGNANVLFAVTNTYNGNFYGLFTVRIRSNNTNINCEKASWLVRTGFTADNIIVNISGMKWTLYVNKTVSQYGRIQFEILSESSINNGTSNVALYSSSTPESTKPTATVTSTDDSTVNYANSAGAVAWGNVTGKPSTFTPASHTHDDRYYTESEVDSKLSGKANTSHTHTKSQITDFPSSLKNPNAITFTGAVTGTYDGSTAKTVDIPKKTKITIVRW